jgi:hypothetical protein
MSQRQSRFHGPRPGFTGSQFVDRISLYSGAGPYSIISALLYIERLHTRTPSLHFTSRSMQRLLLVAVMIAEKYREDINYSANTWYDPSLVHDYSHAHTLVFYQICTFQTLASILLIHLSFANPGPRSAAFPSPSSTRWSWTSSSPSTSTSA